MKTKTKPTIPPHADEHERRLTERATRAALAALERLLAAEPDPVLRVVVRDRAADALRAEATRQYRAIGRR
jgi:hypothetical protein